MFNAFHYRLSGFPFQAAFLSILFYHLRFIALRAASAVASAKAGLHRTSIGARAADVHGPRMSLLKFEPIQ